MMLKGLRFRPAGWVAAIGTMGAMAATMVIASPGGAATPEKEFTASFKQECVVGPGSLNQKGNLEVMTRSKGPETVTEGQEFEPHESTSTITSPAELGNTLFSLGVRKVKGAVTNFELNGIGLTPALLNIAKPAAFPEGLPYEAPVVQNMPTSFTVPHEGTYSFGPYKVTGAAGANAELEVNSEPGFTETGTGEFTATGKGIVSTLEGVNEAGGHVIGPLPVVCTAPKGVVLAAIPISPTSTTRGCIPSTGPPHIERIEPDQGPESGGTQVKIVGHSFEGPISVYFGSKPAAVTGELGNAVIAAAPPGTGTVGVRVVRGEARLVCGGESNSVPFTYTANSELATYTNWTVSGSLTPKRLGQPIELPSGATFNGEGELNSETGAGSVSGNLAIPAFTAPLKLFGVLPVELGMKLTPEGSIAGTVTASRRACPSCEEALAIPLELNLGVTSIGLLGLQIPTHCGTSEPLALGLVDETLTRAQLLTSGWSFAGSTTIPKVKCEGGLLGGLFGAVLSALLSGPENSYAIKVTAPGG
jgi:hypothetical protein